MEQKKTLGLMTVTGCYVLWGIFAIFWRFLAQVNSVYVLAQRIIWSLVFMGLYLLFTRRGREVAAAFRDRKTMVNCLLCGVLITLNWGMYIYAVNSGHVLQASMGYFIEPVAVGLIGVLAFREKPSPGEKVTFLWRWGGHCVFDGPHREPACAGPDGGHSLCHLRGPEEENHLDGPDFAVYGNPVDDAAGPGLFRLVDGPPGGHGGCAGGCGPVAAAGQRGGDLGAPAPV